MNDEENSMEDRQQKRVEEAGNMLQMFNIEDTYEDNAIGPRESHGDTRISITLIGSPGCIVGDHFEFHYEGSHFESTTSVPGIESSTQHWTPRATDKSLDVGNYRRVIDTSGRYRDHCQKQIQPFSVETTPCIEARRVIEMRNSSMLIGGLGEGKSHILRYLSVNPVPGYLPICCKTTAEVKIYLDFVQGSTLKLLFVIDEPFGAEYTQIQLLECWKNVGVDLEMCLDDHKFVFATRKYLWEECKAHLERSPFFRNVVEVTSVTLTTEDKIRLLEKYMGCVEKLSDNEMKEIVSNPNCIAYCQCCKLMAGAIQVGRSGTELLRIFQRPFSFLFSELRKMKKTDYATMSLIMLCGGQLKCKELAGTISDATPNVQKRIHAVLDTLGCKMLTCGDIRQCAEHLSGTFLDKVKRTGTGSNTWEEYKFLHDSIHEAMIMDYGKCHFGHCLTLLDLDFLVKTVRLHDHEKGECDLVLTIPPDSYADVAKVFTTMAVKDDWSLQHVFQNPCVKDESFQLSWIQSLLASPGSLDGFTRNSFPFRVLSNRQITRRHGPDGRCVLYYAAEAGAETLLKFLMDDQHFVCKCGDVCSPICGAAIGNHVDISSYLMREHQPSEDQIVHAVMSACCSGSGNTLRLLLPKLHQQRQKTLACGLKSACEWGYRDIMDTLLPEMESEIRDSVFHKCLVSGIIWHHREVVECLLESCYKPCRGDACVCSIGLKVASQVGQTDVVLVLLSHGANVNAVDGNGETCLQWATSRCHTDTVNCLIKHGADVNLGNKCRVSPLHRSASELDVGSVLLLLINGATANVRDNFLQTPLHVALAGDMDSQKCEKREDVVSKLLEYKTDVTIKDKWNRTVLDVVALGCAKGISDQFSKYGHRLARKTVQKSHPSPSDREEMSRAYRC